MWLCQTPGRHIRKNYSTLQRMWEPPRLIAADRLRSVIENKSAHPAPGVYSFRSSTLSTAASSGHLRNCRFGLHFSDLKVPAQSVSALWGGLDSMEVVCLSLKFAVNWLSVAIFTYFLLEIYLQNSPRYPFERVRDLTEQVFNKLESISFSQLPNEDFPHGKYR